MKVVEVSATYGATIFCDDIRQEIGAKTSFIGAYRNVLVIHGNFPVTLPKFGFGIFLNQLREVFESDVKLKIFLPGDPVEPLGVRESPDTPASIVLDLMSEEEAAAYREYMERKEKEVGSTSYMSTANNFIASPLVLKEPGLISVRAFRKNDVTRLGQLRVLTVADIANAPAQPPKTS